MDDQLKEYACRVFNFDPKEEWESLDHIVNTGRKNTPYGFYFKACMNLAEHFARYIDKNISKH